MRLPLRTDDGSFAIATAQLSTRYRTHGTAAFECRRRSACRLRGILGIGNLSVQLLSIVHSSSKLSFGRFEAVNGHFISVGKQPRSDFWAGIGAGKSMTRPTSGTIRSTKVNRTQCVARSALSFVARSGPDRVCAYNVPRGTRRAHSGAESG